MERDDGGSERSTTDEFLEAASSEAAYQDIKLLNWLLPEARRFVHLKLAGRVGSGEIEELAAKAVEKFYLTFDFAGQADLPIEHARGRFFSFFYIVVKQTVFDFLREMLRKRREQDQPPLPLIEISEDQLAKAKAVIRRLPQREKEFLRLKLVDQRTYAEMQDYYATPRKKPPSISSMKSRMYQIMKRLRKAL